MTGGAQLFCVGAFQGKSRKYVVEFFPVETDKLEALTMMITVTGNTILTLDLC